DFEKTDRFANYLKIASTTTHNIQDPPIAREQHLLLTRVLRTAIEEETIEVYGAYQAVNQCNWEKDIRIHDENVIIEFLTGTPEGENRTFGLLRIIDVADLYATITRPDSLLDHLTTIANYYHGFMDTSTAKRSECSLQQCLSLNLNETFGAVVGDCFEPLAD